MKKFVILLLLAAMGSALSAQVTPSYTQVSMSDMTFGSLGPGRSGNRFDFILPNNNRMIIEVGRIHTLQQLPDFDSLFSKIWEDLRPLYDSLSDPLMQHRVDYVNSGLDVKIRIRQYPPKATYYSYKDDELVQMKVDQDTLRFRGYIPVTLVSGSIFKIAEGYYTVTLILNNIGDVVKLQDGYLEQGLQMLLADLKRELDKPAKKINNIYHYAAYDLRAKKRISPRNDGSIGYNKAIGLAPYAQIGLQFVRGAFVPSAGAGIEFYHSQYNYSKFAIRLLWEPHFYFKRDDKDKVIMQRNDFLTLQFYTGFNNTGPGRTFSWNQNFSVGALINRNGELFEKNTFKFSLPGLQSKNVLIEPEFFFNNFFRNFSPSMKLTVSLD